MSNCSWRRATTASSCPCTWTPRCCSGCASAVRCASLSAHNLADFCTALEGVSHFHYYVWNADRARDVSLLDLELQAEVDKYAAALRLILAQREGRFPRELFRQLFDAADFLPDLTPVERERYGEAHHFAARFCRRLEERFMCGRRARPDALLQELRRFYRLGRHAKLRHAQQWS